MSPKILRNIAKCKKCGDTIESRSVHHFVWCSCKSVFTDGGHDYIRRGETEPGILEDLSVFESDMAGGDQ